MKIGNLFLFVFCFVSFQAFSQSVWQKVIEGDIKHIYTTVKDNHPGYLDTENAYFREWHELGYQQALAQAETAHSLNDAMTVISTYVAGFGDGHFFLNLKYQPKHIQWAGIKMARYGNDYRVSYVDAEHAPTMPKPMARLISCENKLADDIVREDVLKYRFNTPALNFPKVWYASRILVDDGIGQRNHFKTCEFEQNGKTKNFKLVWKRISNSEYRNKTSTGTSSKQYSFQKVADNKYWITLPRFHPSKEEQKALKNVIDNVAAVSESAKQFVVDVRGNSGGNSQWGVEIAKAIYGEEYVEHQLSIRPDKSFALWRVSEDTANYVEGLLGMIIDQFGEDSDIYKDFSKLAVDMRTALKRRTSFVRQSSEENNRAVHYGDAVRPASKARVLFLTDGSCGSACLDFADLMLKLPNVFHIGQETGADTVYMDIRHVDLPSGLGSFSLAQKVYRDRPRKHNQSYLPAYFYNADISDTEKLKAWIKTLEFN